jgi:hypothetical protein
MFGVSGEQPKRVTKKAPLRAKKSFNCSADDQSTVIEPAEHNVEDVQGADTVDIVDMETAARLLCVLIAKTDRYYLK